LPLFHNYRYPYAYFIPTKIPLDFFKKLEVNVNSAFLIKAK